MKKYKESMDKMKSKTKDFNEVKGLIKLYQKYYLRVKKYKYAINE